MMSEQELRDCIENLFDQQGLGDLRQYLTNLLFDSFLSWSIPSDDTHKPNGIIAFAFGHRVDKSGNRSSGPINELLADRLLHYSQKFDCPVWAQWEIGKIVEGRISKLNVIYPTYDNGKPIYLNTRGILELVKKDIEEGKTLFVIAHHDHLWRCVNSQKNLAIMQSLLKRICHRNMIQNRVKYGLETKRGMF